MNGRFGRIQLERKKTKTTPGHITANDIRNIKMPDFSTPQKAMVEVFSKESSDTERKEQDAKDMLTKAKNKIQDTIIGR